MRRSRAKRSRPSSTETNKQTLQIEDLQRYAIQTVLVDEYSEVTDLLLRISRRLELRNVFVSGSAHQSEEFGEDRMRDLCMLLGETLMRRDCRLICGMGLNVGDAVVKGALVRLFMTGDPPSERRLLLRPFPRNLPQDMGEAEFNESYRRAVIKPAGVAVFIAGTSRSAPVSKGVIEEYRIARELGKIPVPVGATGFAARQIWDEVKGSRESIYGGRVSERLFNRLADPRLSNKQIVAAIFDVIEAVSQP